MSKSIEISILEGVGSLYKFSSGKLVYLKIWKVFVFGIYMGKGEIVWDGVGVGRGKIVLCIVRAGCWDFEYDGF